MTDSLGVPAPPPPAPGTDIGVPAPVPPADVTAPLVPTVPTTSDTPAAPTAPVAAPAPAPAAMPTAAEIAAELIAQGAVPTATPAPTGPAPAKDPVDTNQFTKGSVVVHEWDDPYDGLSQRYGLVVETFPDEGSGASSAIAWFSEGVSGPIGDQYLSAV